jgi:hypothetical protein
MFSSFHPKEFANIFTYIAILTKILPFVNVFFPLRP